ncbi:indole-3-glycerol phosphate synthase TrpC [Adhaeretor mobilis]|uniref:Indole-3-glycerol phosphate synthase n=1 Tax=Adhaeretor mobilis TaxID=1930276 RepID=A0A517MUF0_9BACT|nr:indole-3-glycerol phosphate synthase TrpC [Adhaeretor mobilis]QDS98513.1 Indole-3-glycerol phosphate synthase [Adhaeretor mobilis]
MSETILDKIVAEKRKEVAEKFAQVTVEELQCQAAEAPPVRDFFAALADSSGVSLIAEVKKASPSAGIIREDFDPATIAKTYQQHGASCISVLTDEPFFQGKLEYLTTVRNVVDIPVLRKDFLIDSRQLLEARIAGADAVLLIAECLDDCNLRKLHNEAIDLGMTPLVEYYEPANRQRVLDAGATLIGVNNRDLRTFKVDIAHTLRQKELLPEECLLVAESGIHTREHVLQLEAAGVDAMLVGESLMRETDIGAAVQRLLDS